MSIRSIVDRWLDASTGALYRATDEKAAPELRLFDREHRKAVLKKFDNSRRRFGRITLLAIVCIGCAATLFIAICFSHPASLVLIFTIIAALPFAQAYLYNRPLRQFLRQELAARGVPICIHCGYDLRGQTEPRCPECGHAFERTPDSP